MMVFDDVQTINNLKDSIMDDKEINQLVLDTSRELEEILNDGLLKEYAKLHNIDDKYNKFSLKQEIVGKGAFFLDVKKHYAIYVTNEEGVDVDKLVIKGLVTQRSDYPSFAKQKIKELLKLLIIEKYKNRTEMKKQILDFCEVSRLEILEKVITGQKEIARPVSFSKELTSYKRAPIQIQGMELWNFCEYDIFVPGTKGYLFKILGIDYDKAPDRIKGKQQEISNKQLQYIVLPIESERLPDYYIINVEEMMRFAWIDRVQELLKCAPWNNDVIQNNKEGVINLEDLLKK